MGITWFRRRKDILTRLERILAGEIAPEETAKWLSHVATSPEAHEELTRLHQSAELVREACQESPQAEHLSANELAEYLIGEGSSVERARRAAHLATCRECRSSFVTAATAYIAYEKEVGSRLGFGYNLRRWARPALLGIVPGVCLGLYLLGYFLTPYDPVWLHGLAHSPWVQLIGAGSAIYAIWTLARNRY